MHKSALKAISLLLIIFLVCGGLIYYVFTHHYEMLSENSSRETFSSDQKESSKPSFDPRKYSSLLLELDTSKILTKDQLDNITDRTIEVIKHRIEQYGINNSVIRKEKERFISVNFPGAVDMEKIRALVTNNDKLEFRLVENGNNVHEVLNKIDEFNSPFYYDGTLKEEFKKLLPEGITVMPHKDGGYLAVVDMVALSGEDLENVRVVNDDYGFPSILFQITPEGAKKFGHFTAANIGRQLAIIFGNKILSAPIINSRISAHVQISGQFTKEEAKQLAIILDTGTLPTSVSVSETRIRK